MKVAVIIARGGSKRILRKNIKLFSGKPIIAWPIEVAKQSGIFDHIIVSTDDKEIAEVSKSYGAEVPFIRPAELADDYSGTIEVISHSVSWMFEQEWEPEAVCCIYATSVFLTVKDMKKGFHALTTADWSYAFSVTDFEYPIFRSLKEPSSGGIEMFFPEKCLVLIRTKTLSTSGHANRIFSSRACPRKPVPPVTKIFFPLK